MATIAVTKIVATRRMSRTQPEVAKGPTSRLHGNFFGRDSTDGKPLTIDLSTHHSPNLRRIHRADARMPLGVPPARRAHRGQSKNSDCRGLGKVQARVQVQSVTRLHVKRSATPASAALPPSTRDRHVPSGRMRRQLNAPGLAATRRPHHPECLSLPTAKQMRSVLQPGTRPPRTSRSALPRVTKWSGGSFVAKVHGERLVRRVAASKLPSFQRTGGCTRRIGRHRHPPSS